MRSRLYSEGKNVVLGEPWFTRCYAVPIINKDSVIRWIAAKVDVNNPGEGESFRLLRVSTVMEMEFAKQA